MPVWGRHLPPSHISPHGAALYAEVLGDLAHGPLHRAGGEGVGGAHADTTAHRA